MIEMDLGSQQKLLSGSVDQNFVDRLADEDRSRGVKELLKRGALDSVESFFKNLDNIPKKNRRFGKR